MMQHIEKADMIELWQLARSGETATAQKKINDLLETNPEHIPAWLLLAEITETHEEKARCYQRVLAMDPQNRWARSFFKAHPKSRTQTNVSAIPELFEDESAPQNLTCIEIDGSEDENVEEDTTHVDQDADVGLALYVVQESGRHADQDDIIREVSLRRHINWYDAEKLVNSIQQAHALAIAKRRTPLQLLIAIPTMMGGAGWFLWTITTALSTKGDILTMSTLLAQSYGQLISSIAMILGGSLGLYRVLKSLGKVKLRDY